MGLLRVLYWKVLKTKLESATASAILCGKLGGWGVGGGGGDCGATVIDTLQRPMSKTVGIKHGSYLIKDTEAITLQKLIR